MCLQNFPTCICQSNTNAIYFEPVFGSTDGGTRTFYLNRTVGSAGMVNHENGISTGRITEIRQ